MVDYWIWRIRVLSVIKRREEARKIERNWSVTSRDDRKYVCYVMYVCKWSIERKFSRLVDVHWPILACTAASMSLKNKFHKLLSSSRWCYHNRSVSVSKLLCLRYQSSSIDNVFVVKNILINNNCSYKWHQFVWIVNSWIAL